MDTRVNITMPRDFLKQVDGEAKREHRSRSELIREALRAYLKTSKEEQAEVERKQKALRAAAVQDRIREKTATIDIVAEIRKMRDSR